MPLVVMCGIPSSGKTKRAKELFKEIERIGHTVYLVSESTEIAANQLSKDACYSSQNNEKQLRAALKAKVISLLNPQTTVILDSSNYIKGFRYELYCASKACKTTQCTIFTIININEAWQFNDSRKSDTKNDCNNTMENNTSSENIEHNMKILSKRIEEAPYCKEIFDGLVLRFEEPNSQNRWDSPLFVPQPEEQLDIKTICNVLYEKKPPPPNMSTQNPPLSSTNFLYELDRIIQDISKQILENKKINPHSEMTFPKYQSNKLSAESVQAIQPALLQKLRRQFLSFAKMQYSNHDVSQIGILYIQYLNSSLLE